MCTVYTRIQLGMPKLAINITNGPAQNLQITTIYHIESLLWYKKIIL